MKKLLVPVWVGALILAGCSGSSNILQAPKQLSDDFFVTIAKVGKSLPGAAMLKLQPLDEQASCEEQLKRAVCETTASVSDITHEYSKIACAPDSAKYVPALMTIYQEMPERMRPSLCSLDRVFISDGITTIAFASVVTDEIGQYTGGYIGMRKATFLAQPTLEQVLSWKEQLAYGGSKTFLSNDLSLVQIHLRLKMSVLKSDGLFFVLMHELGHLIDFNNHINSVRSPDTEWANLSWGNGVPLSDATYYKRDEICFYDCHQAPIAPTDASKIYESLKASAFVTTYASQNPREDFAENWAFRMMENYKNPDYQIEVPGQGSVEMNEVFRSNPKIRAKQEFIDRLWNDPKLVIDNRVH